MSYFNKEKPCQSVKIWSRQPMTPDMMQFGWSVFNRYNKEIQSGDVSTDGCVYSNKFYAASAKKTKGGCASICVRDRSNEINNRYP